MHPRNRFHPSNIGKPSYVEMAKKSKEFGEIFGNGENNDIKIDYSNPQHTLVLNQTISRLYFGGLEFKLSSPDSLCPTIASSFQCRLDYLHWIEDLLLLVGVDYYQENVKGIDIGTGSTCIYPLLGTFLHRNWSFSATEIDEDSIRCAESNVSLNNKSELIKVIPVQDPQKCYLKEICTNEKFHFVVCNPPFYKSADHIESGKRSKTTPSPSAHRYTQSESVYPMGEFGFVSNIIDDSFLVRHQCFWFTSLIGFKQNLAPLRQRISKLDPVMIKEFSIKIGKTVRWILAWTWHVVSNRVESGFGLPQVQIYFPLSVPHPKMLITSELSEIGAAQISETFTLKYKTWTRKVKRKLCRGIELDAMDECNLCFKLHGSGCTVTLAANINSDQQENLSMLGSFLRSKVPNLAV